MDDHHVDSLEGEGLEGLASTRCDCHSRPEKEGHIAAESTRHFTYRAAIENLRIRVAKGRQDRRGVAAGAAKPGSGRNPLSKLDGRQAQIWIPLRDQLQRQL